MRLHYVKLSMPGIVFVENIEFMFFVLIVFFVTDTDDIDDDYKPDAIDISTVEAIEITDEKEGNIYIYFGIRQHCQVMK